MDLDIGISIDIGLGIRVDGGKSHKLGGLFKKRLFFCLNKIILNDPMTRILAGPIRKLILSH